MPPPAFRVVLLIATVFAGACFSFRDFESGELICDEGKCPPGMECRGDNRCYKPADVGKDAVTVDAPLVLDAPPSDARRDAPSVDAPPLIFDAVPCTQGEHRCTSGNLEICQTGLWTPALPSCGDLGQQCFDPGPSGGTDAYCGTCLKGAERCSVNVRQTCPATGIWTDGESCTAFGCYDLDGPNGPQSYCGECANGDKRCSGGLQACADGRWGTAMDCTVMAGWTCFDPAPAGGSDAYCGLCLKNSTQCRGDNLDMCNAQGSDFTTLQGCTWGCDTGTLSCCGQPDCTGLVCGSAPFNACGRTLSCGSCSGTCCDSGARCCSASQQCCDTVCCSPIATCCEPGFCTTGPCKR